MSLAILIGRLFCLFCLAVFFTISMLLLLFGMYLQQYDAAIWGVVFSAITGGLAWGLVRAEG